MKHELLDRIRQITDEEQLILDHKAGVDKERYTNQKEFIVDSAKMLEKGKLIDVRVHTRFVKFPKHTHNYIEIIYMCEGSTHHIVDDIEEVILEKGDLLFLNQTSSHEIMPAGLNDIAINFIVLPDFFDMAFKMLEDENILRDFIIGSLMTDHNTSSYLHFKVADVLPIQNLVENMVWSLLNDQTNKRQINQTTMGLLFLQLVDSIDKIEYQQGNQYERQMIMEILHYIETSYKTAALGELAVSMNQSIYQMSKFIKQHTGQTFKELLQTKRLNQAAYLLAKTRLPISDIIYHVGYDNTSYFHKVFKTRYGTTPKKYRAETSRQT